jgi:hypothetical protein
MERDFVPKARLTPEVVRNMFRTKDVRLVIDIEEPLRFLDVSPEMNVEFTDAIGHTFAIPLYAVSMMRMEDAREFPQGTLTSDLIREAFRVGKVRFVVDIQAPKLVLKDVTQRSNLVFCDCEGHVFLVPLSAIKLARPKKTYPLEDRTRPIKDRRMAPRVYTPTHVNQSGWGIIQKILGQRNIFRSSK